MFTDANLIGFLVDFGFPVNHANALRPEEIAASKGHERLHSQVLGSNRMGRK